MLCKNRQSLYKMCKEKNQVKTMGSKDKVR